jgi:hypothetical protein
MRRRGLAVLLPLALGLWAAPGASASNRIYWGDQYSGAISFANLDGTGQGGDLNISPLTPYSPEGAALDLVGGRIYFAEPGASNRIEFANLDGTGGGGYLNTTGATISQPVGVAVDRAQNRVYWANFNKNTISYASLTGKGGGDLNTTGADVYGPAGVAIDPATGKIYWSNYDGTISFANLNGTGGDGDLNTTGATVGLSVEGLAIDSRNGKIYWANVGNGTDRDHHPLISFANLNDTGGGGDLNTTGAAPGVAVGVAIDPIGGYIYWGNWVSHGISFAKLDDTGGGGDLNTTGASQPVRPTFPVLLKAPRATTRPRVTGGSTFGSTLSCSLGQWAPDLLESFLYQRPVSFSYQWFVNGGAIPGLRGSAITALGAGAYTCRVTATNQAGSTDNTSAPHNIT